VTRPWPAGAATGIGSLPGTDAGEAMRLVFGELPELPHLPELPARGPGAGLLGRGAAFLVDLPVEIAPTGWRMTSRPGRDLRQARDLLERDLDALVEHGAQHRGAFKVQLAGPWTLAAGVELASGHRVLTDTGAVRELAASLAEGLRGHLADIAARLPGADLVVQLDEPSLPAVLAGTLPTASGYGTVRAVDAVVVEQGLADVLATVAVGRRVVHCCAPDVPIGLLHAAGADALALDAALLGTGLYDALGTAVDDGLSLWLGVVPGAGGLADAELDVARSRVHRLWQALGFPAAQAAEQVVPTPACGLAGATADYARRAMRTVRDVGRSLLES
jgi:hypothetical protein